MRRIALFNSFPFHYEMFGYIINYCRIKQYDLTIYTNTKNDYNWLSFYKSHFTVKLQYNFKYDETSSFENNMHLYDLIVLATDDDPLFNTNWINSTNIDKIICIQHYYLMRRHGFNHYLTTRPYDNSVSPFYIWALPCFPLVDVNEKNVAISQVAINIAIIGGIYSKYNASIINRFCSVFNKPIHIYIIARCINDTHVDDLRKHVSSNISLHIHKKLDTFEMFEIIKKMNYVFLDITTTSGHEYKSGSGAIAIGVTCLTSFLISKTTNRFYQFKNALEYDENSSDPIFLDIAPIDVESVELERRQLTLKLFNFLDTVIEPTQINTALIIEPRRLPNLPQILDQYKFILGSNWKIVFYCGKNDKMHWANILTNTDIELRELSENNLSAFQYNDFCKQKSLWKSLYGKYVLVFQSDTWIHNDDTYTIEYFTNLNKGYIGGNMSYPWLELMRENIQFSYANFNGGLSLRNRINMLDIIDKFPPQPTQSPSTRLETDAEDVYFTIGCKRLGIAVGDDDACGHFAMHTIFHDKYFGIHKPNSNIKQQLRELDSSINNPYL